MKSIFLIIGCSLLWLTPCLNQTQPTQKNIVIDERTTAPEIRKRIPVDKVWAGHPVSFSLLTHEEWQYIAYYNEERHMLVGQRLLDDDQFELEILVSTSLQFAQQLQQQLLKRMLMKSWTS